MARLRTLKPRLQAFKPERPRFVSIQDEPSDSWRAGKTTTERGYDGRWKKAREAYLRKHPLCLYCEREGRITAATVVDHIVPHRGDKAIFWDSSNWQPLCKACHDSVKAKEERPWRKSENRQ